MRAGLRALALGYALLHATASLAGIISFTVAPATFLPGQEVTLSWSVTPGDVISINQGVGPVSGATGSVTVLPTATTTYTLTNSTSGTSAQGTATLFAPPTLKHRWSFSEASGTTVNDSVGTAHGIIRGTGWSRTNASGGGASPDRVRLPGGGSGSAPYIDLPNAIMNGLTQVTFEGWLTLHGAQNWSRYFDFGTSTIGEVNAPGGSFDGSEYMLISAQVGGTTTSRRLAMKDNGVENSFDVTGDAVTYGTEFHFAAVYDPAGNNGTPRFSYYKNGVLLGSLNTAFRPQDLVFVNNWLGRSNWSGDNNTNGSYNEFRIWNGPLSAAAISANFTAGANTVPAPAPITSFTAFPALTVYQGTSVRLSYLLADGATGSIDQGIGSVSGSAGYVTVTPQATTTYTLTASNGGAPQTAAVTIQVIPSAPTAEPQSVAVPYQTATPITLIAHDPNTPAGALTYTIVSAPQHGSLTGSGASRTYTPAAGHAGPDSFTFKANDGTSDSNVAAVAITVQPAPAAPTGITLDAAAYYTDFVNGSFVGLLGAVDANPDDTFTFALVSGAGSTHNAWFTIHGHQLLAARNFSGDLGVNVSIRVRVTDDDGGTFEQIITRTVEERPLRVKINEINYNPSRNTLATEFIELYNPTAAAVDMSNWRFANGVSYVFPPGTAIPAGGYLVVAENPTVLTGLYGISALGPWTGGLSSDGEEIELRDAAGATVDRVDYGITAPWPVPPNGDGPSLELAHPSLPNNLGGNWRASTAAQTAVTYVAAGSGSWKYFKGTSEASSPLTAWRAAGFNDAGWLTGTMPIGVFKLNSNTAQATSAETGVTLATQLTDMATFSGGSFTTAYRCVFFRKTFNVSGTIPRALVLRVMHNDAAIVWINGQEVARFGFQPAAPTDPPFNSTAYYELGNDPWSDTVLLNAGALLQPGTNTIAIQGFAKPPAPRPTGGGPTQQEDLGLYNVFDFCIDADLRAATDLLGTPGAQNSTFATIAPPAVRNISHTPRAPKPWEPIVVTARVSDPQGVGSVQLKYQLCAPGSFIPATLPLSNAAILANPRQPLPANPAFENPANWTTLAMVDDGSVAGDVPGDGVFTARIPAQPHRTLVRYRIVATDLGGASVTVPISSDPRKNFAAYVYHALPAYTSGSQVFAPAALATLPVYHWITRASDYSALLAYNASEQFSNNNDLATLLARHYENFEGALVVGDQVIDHTVVRLRGGNSRYMGAGKRHFRFNFPKGTPLQAADEAGRPYPRPWEEMLFNKLFGNKGAYDWGLTYEVGGKLWELQGTPMPASHWVHFRVVQNANETDAAQGDFWGLYQALELPEGKNFLAARNLPAGNFYKMTDWQQNAQMNQRYQAKGAVDYGEDFDNIRYNIHQTTPQSDIERYIDLPRWYRYEAVKEAVRHYDIFCEPTGRHRVKNLIWYFAPKADTNGLGQLWQMPYDWDASFGPTWNAGYDYVHNAIFDRADVADSPTWSLPKLDRTAMQIETRNYIREFRDLVWYRDGSGRGPVDDLIDDALAKIAAFYPADMARWPAPGAAAVFSGGAPAKAQDMKNFCFVGWTDAFGGDPAVGAGGRAAYLDSISDALDVGLLPATPAISYSGTAGYPVDGLVFTSSAFSDPQGAGTFSAMQWRIGEVTDPAAPAYDPSAERIYEATPVWESGVLPAFNANIAVPGTALRVGHTYRARVRHRDATGRWSQWSAPLQFTAGTSNYVQVLKDNLMVSEVMYHPAAANAAEVSAGHVESDFEFLELLNISNALTLDLTNVRFTKGVDFNFAGSAITSLAPGARALVVKKVSAFTMRYGSGKPIAGAWAASDNLSNSGEQVKLSYGAGAAIHDFEYDDVLPWPPQADAGGYSLVLINPASRPNHALPTNWRASFDFGGSPGGADTTSYAGWAAANGATDVLADDDGDGLANLVEYALGGTNLASDRGRQPLATIQTLFVNGVTAPYLTFSFRRSQRVEDVAYTVQFSADLNDWAASGTLLSTTPHGDATYTELWRAPVPVSAGRYFARLRISRP
jgi:hypothetical protein